MYYWLIGLVGLLEDWVCNSLSKRPWDGILLRNKMQYVRKHLHMQHVHIHGMTKEIYGNTEEHTAAYCSILVCKGNSLV